MVSFDQMAQVEVLLVYVWSLVKKKPVCDHLEGWDREGGRETQEGGDMGICVYVWLIHFVIKQKLTHHCKAIILQ